MIFIEKIEVKFENNQQSYCKISGRLKSKQPVSIIVCNPYKCEEK